MSVLQQSKSWFKNSLTILWARIVALTGVALSYVSVVQGVDLSQWVGAKFWPIYLIVVGFLTELARRRTVTSATNEDNVIVDKKTGKKKK